MSNWHPEALAAAMRSLPATHTLSWHQLPSHSHQIYIDQATSAKAQVLINNSMSGSVFIFHDEANNWHAVNFPNKPRGFEGQSAKNFDGIEPHDLAVAEMREAGQAFVTAARGAEMTNAISALHRGHKSDGRPHSFCPEAE